MSVRWEDFLALGGRTCFSHQPPHHAVAFDQFNPSQPRPPSFSRSTQLQSIIQHPFHTLNQLGHAYRHHSRLQHVTNPVNHLQQQILPGPAARNPLSTRTPYHSFWPAVAARRSQQPPKCLLWRVGTMTPTFKVNCSQPLQPRQMFPPHEYR